MNRFGQNEAFQKLKEVDKNRQEHLGCQPTTLPYTMSQRLLQAEKIKERFKEVGVDRLWMIEPGMYCHHEHQALCAAAER